jgi:hypothetical protein
MISVSVKWGKYPNARFGILFIGGVQNREGSNQLDKKRELPEERLRSRYSGMDRKEVSAQPPFAEYQRYFKKFKQNYPVLFQLETVAFKGRSLSSPSPLVATMFMAELFPDLMLEAAMIDRITHRSHVLDMNGASCRLAETKRRKVKESGSI